MIRGPKDLQQGLLLQLVLIGVLLPGGFYLWMHASATGSWWERAGGGLALCGASVAGWSLWSKA